MKNIAKPKHGELADYAWQYVDLLPDDGLVLRHLQTNFAKVKELATSLPEEALLSRYAAGKWTIKEILVHLVDDERIYAYRALRFARKDPTALPGFEQDPYIDFSAANRRELTSIFREYECVRLATVAMFDGFEDEAMTRCGTADGTTMSVRAIAYHIAGHELHHLNVIKTRYLSP